MSIKFEKVNYIYAKKTPFESHVLRDLSIDFKPRQITGIIGSTGSGKSTLVQHINGLLKPTNGSIIFNNKDFNLKITHNIRKKKLAQLTQHVGLIFQFPEYQLFEETVKRDILFGPKNIYGNKQLQKIIPDYDKYVENLLIQVGLDSSLANRNPFDLSGGQKRRVAIAGILAMGTDWIIFDEPTAGLDPQGERKIINIIKNLKKQGKNIIIVSHNMELILELADEICLLNNGRIICQGKAQNIFSNNEFIKKGNIVLPKIYQIANKLNQKGFSINFNNFKSLNDLINQIVIKLK